MKSTAPPLAWRSPWLWAPLAVWTLVVVLAARLGADRRGLYRVTAMPIMGDVDPVLSATVVAVLVGGVALALVLPDWCRRLGWRRMLALVVLVGVGWGVALALVRGHDDIDRGLDSRFEYVAVVPTVQEQGIGPFAETFTDPDVLATYPIHVQGHPLGATLLFVALDEVGLGGPYRAMWVMVVAGALAAPAVLVAARAVAGEEMARRAAPFLALGPAAIWHVSSGDALFTGAGAVAVALVVVAACRARPGDRPPNSATAWSPRRVAVVGALGGVAFGVAVQLAYGLAVLVVIPAVVAARYRRWAVLAWAAVGGLAVLAVVGLAGFWWFDGLDATRSRYVAGVASARDYGFFVPLGNPAAFALATGPAALVGLAHLRDRRLALLVGGGWLTVAVANLSGMSKAEVERIWLPFVPWVLLAAAALTPRGVRDRRPGADGDAETGDHVGDDDRARPPADRRRPTATHLLVVQVVVAVAIESYVLTPW